MRIRIVEQLVDILYVVERIIEVEAEFRCFAELKTHLLRQFVAYGLGIACDVLEYLLRF